jgi:hypothetical protein
MEKDTKKKKLVEPETIKRSVSAESLIRKISFQVAYKVHDMAKLCKIFEQVTPNIRSCEWNPDTQLFDIEEGRPLTAEERKARWEARNKSKQNRRGRKWT